MTQIEFEKRRVAQIKAFNVMSGNRTMKIIDFVELLLEIEPGQLIVLPNAFVLSLKDSAFVLKCPGRLLPSPRAEENRM